ncbi:glycosyltransferase family 2 protein [Microbacterium sp.]|uniref:glycosyltransferase family 2 protein n=1 Tax=Microbacterium sp. TaxID=51671 RepID=UPI0039E72651
MTIDIMLPFYGRADHFAQAVRSVLAQTDGNWRLVVIDDANPDTAPGEWARSLADPRVEYRRHERNLGINATFQECIDLSRAEWVTIFGCDDVMRPGYIARVRELIARHTAARIVHPGTGIIDAEGRPARTLVDTAKALYRPRGPRPLLLSGAELATSLTRGNWMNFPALVWHGPTIREIGFQQGYDVVQDLALALDVCRAGGALLLDDEIVFDYRRHGGSVSSWRAVDGSRFTEEREFFTALVADFRDRGWHRAARAARMHLSSRLNALTRMPSALRAGDRAGLAVLAGHVFLP